MRAVSRSHGDESGRATGLPRRLVEEQPQKSEFYSSPSDSGGRPPLAIIDTAPVSAPEARTAYVKMRRAVDALITGSEPIRARLQMAEESFGAIDPEAELTTELERNLYHRIASSLVSGGPEEEGDEDAEHSPEAVAESIAMLDDLIALLIARDMLRLYELTASPPDGSLRWPQERWPDDRRE